jgi:hypothetical protein
MRKTFGLVSDVVRLVLAVIVIILSGVFIALPIICSEKVNLRRRYARIPGEVHRDI